MARKVENPPAEQQFGAGRGNPWYQAKTALCFHSLTNCLSANNFTLILLPLPSGVGALPGKIFGLASSPDGFNTACF
jgi:hypothetical protein